MKHGIETETVPRQQAEEADLEKAGKYLTFTLNQEEFGLEILKVKEIIGLLNITNIPGTPRNIRGVINLRGKVIPVIDLRIKFGMETVEDTAERCIIVVDTLKNNKSVLMGILVDSVSEVMDIAPKEIDNRPSFGANIETDFLLGIGKIRNKVILLLDIDNILHSRASVPVESA